MKVPDLDALSVYWKNMKYIVVFVFSVTSLFSLSVLANDSVLQQAYQTQSNDVQVKGSGYVIRILADDNEGSRHQKFILKLASGQTLLVAHNIDLAPKVKHLKVGDNIRFYGEYEWSRQGGVMHWTHLDPNDRHIAGWLKHKGKTYQ